MKKLKVQTILTCGNITWKLLFYFQTASYRLRNLHWTMYALFFHVIHKNITTNNLFFTIVFETSLNFDESFYDHSTTLFERCESSNVLKYEADHHTGGKFRGLNYLKMGRTSKWLNSPLSEANCRLPITTIHFSHERPHNQFSFLNKFST